MKVDGENFFLKLSIALKEEYSSRKGLSIDNVGVGLRSFFVLFCLAVRDGPFGVRSKEIADSLEVSVQCVNRHLHRLKKWDLVEEEESNHEKRASRWHLNEKLRSEIENIL